METTTKQAFSEVYDIIAHMDTSIRMKIPKSFIKLIKDNMDTNYNVNIDYSQSIVNQNLLHETKVLLSLIYRDYICDEKKKKEAMTQEERKAQEEKEKKQEKAMMGGTVAFSVVFALGLFFFLPYFLSGIFHKVISSDTVIALLEGLIRLAIFIGYIALISLTPDIKRVFMYHGAEHKCINCIEHGMELNVENVRKSSRQHKRCGTSFLLIVMLISIVFFLFIRVDSRILQLVLRLLLIPVIAGVSYEFIRLAGRYDNRLVNILSKPGLWMQKMTTKEPDDEMIEVGIASVEAVFDWRKWQKEENV